jgi:hypothetical protein
MVEVSKTTLAAYGFVEAGRWALNQNVKSGIKFTLERYGTERVVYAFVVQDVVKYLGACREQDLRAQMKDYQYQGAQEKGGGTNKHVATKIKESLQAGQVVDIVALKPDDDLKFRDLDVDLVAGLEKPFISLCNPDWNREPRRTRQKQLRQALPELVRLVKKGDMEGLRNRGLTNDDIQSLSESVEKSLRSTESRNPDSPRAAEG